MNLSHYPDQMTARTSPVCAEQRAINLYSLNVASVLELCVGPSLRILERAYSVYNISVTGNDIDPRWVEYYPTGRWILGDARKLNTSGFDAVVVAPPLSRGCSGTRRDALTVDQVIPAYTDFLQLINRVICFVLPGRSLSTREDRSQLWGFISKLEGNVQIVPLVDKVVKYVDVYCCRR